MGRRPSPYWWGGVEMADVVEVMAVAHFERDGNRWDRPEMTDADRAAFMADMQAALSALDAAGYAVVPKEPTMAMLRAFQNMTDDNGSCLVIPGYRAMLSAAQVKP